MQNSFFDNGMIGEEEKYILSVLLFDLEFSTEESNESNLYYVGFLSNRQILWTAVL